MRQSTAKEKSEFWVNCFADKSLIQNKDPVGGKFAVIFVGKEHLKVQIPLSSAVECQR